MFQQHRRCRHDSSLNRLGEMYKYPNIEECNFIGDKGVKSLSDVLNNCIPVFTGQVLCYVSQIGSPIGGYSVVTTCIGPGSYHHTYHDWRDSNLQTLNLCSNQIHCEGMISLSIALYIYK